MNHCEDCGKETSKTLTLIKTVNTSGDHGYLEKGLCSECIKDAQDTDLIIKSEEELTEWIHSHDLDEILDDSESFYLVGC